MLQGYSLPLSPLGQANIVGTPPWHFSGDTIAFEFWSSAHAAGAILPPGLTMDSDESGRMLALFTDWQFTAQDNELLDPARYQYREFCVLVAARWKEKPVYWTPYAYCDNDSAIARGWIQGCPKKLGSIYQTRTFAAPGPASAPIAPGSKFGVSLSANGRRLANGRLTLRQERAATQFALDRPTVGRRFLPNLAAGHHHAPAVDDLVLAVPDDFTIIDVWSGDAELTFPEVVGDELHILGPVRVSAGYRFSLSSTISDLTVLKSFTK